jgi:hypothetical protein
MGLADRVAQLISVSAFANKGPQIGNKIDSEFVDRMREAFGGNLTSIPQTKLEWFLQEVDEASKLADMGDLKRASQLVRSMKRDPIISGLLATKSGGIVRLPRKWSGSQVVIDSLESKDSGIPRFDLLCPPQEVKAMADDGDLLGVGLGELVPVPGRSYSVLERKEPEFIWYNWANNTWHYRSNAGLLLIEPGLGRWVLHLQGPRLAPWQQGKWHSLGRSWVRKDSIQHLKTNWAFKLANAARVAVAPRAAARDQRLNWFRQVAAWGVNTVFSVAEGWDVKLIESNGRGWEGFDTSIKEANEDFMINLAGQLVSVTGGTGFSSEDLYASIRWDLIRDVATPLGYTLSTQVIPPYVFDNYPEEFDANTSLEYQVVKPSDLSAEASIYTALGAGLAQLQQVAAAAGLGINVGEFFEKFGIPTHALKPEEAELIAKLLVDSEPADSNEGVKKVAATLYTLGKAMRERRAA